MTDKSKQATPPYATFGAFIGFLDKLRESKIPSRIDPSVFGNASGSITYSTIAALKFLRLIDENGVPSKQFGKLVQATESDRKSLLKEIAKSGYPTLFNGQIDLESITAAQFDEHMRDEYGAQGSTIDKIAAFFIGLANAADIPLSPHLRARKAVASATSTRKVSKQRKRAEDEDDSTTPPPPPPPAPEPKALEYQLIDLLSEATDDDEVKNSIWKVVQFLAARKLKASQ